MLRSSRPYIVSLRAKAWPLAALIAAFAVLAAAPASAFADFTWTGATPTGAGASNWSNASNWGGTVPSGSVGTLTFPTLTNAACTASPPTDTCYQSNNDLIGIAASAISLQFGLSGAEYSISGNGITLGSGGITAAPSAGNSLGGASLNLPIALTAPQTWSITNGSLDLVQGVSGSLSALTIDLSAEGSVSVGSTDDEVGPVTISGSGANPGIFDLGTPGASGSLNATDGNAVSVTGGADLSTLASSTGPLSLSAGHVQIGQNGDVQAGDLDLAVDGAATLGSGSGLLMFINQAGTIAGSDYSQLSATGNVNLTGAGLVVQGETPGVMPTCPNLPVGEVETLVSTPGALSGTFVNAPDGTAFPLGCFGGTPPYVRINYTTHTVTATVVNPTTTALTEAPANPVTNQTVTLTATVTAGSGTPSGGTVAFSRNAVPILGCTSQPVSWSGTTGTATCQTAFAASQSSELLEAVFTPAALTFQGSTSPPETLPVGEDATATTVVASSTTPAAGTRVTYTAAVTPANAGANAPSGPVEFLDNGTPIGGCTNQVVTAGGASSLATCTVSYRSGGVHSITATYSGDQNFSRSTSPALNLRVGSTLRPVVGQSEAAFPVSGTVLIRLRGTRRFFRLRAGQLIPDGSEIDTTNGRVRLIVASNTHGGTSTAELYGGRFIVHQTRGVVPHTIFALSLPLSGCVPVISPASPYATITRARPRRPTTRHVWVTEQGGNFNTKGQYVGTSVQGTIWLTADTCTSSTVRVRQGVVVVHDLIHHRTIKLHAGQSYTARKTH